MVTQTHEERAEMRTAGKRALSDVQKRPQFHNIVGFSKLADSFPLAELRKVAVESKINPSGWTQPENFRAVATIGTDEVHAFMGKNYHLVQHRESLFPVIEGLRDLGIEFQGGNYQYMRKDGTPSGTKMNVALLFKGDQFHFTAGRSYRVGVGVVVRNSLDGSGSVSIQGFGVNGICTNSIFADKLLGRIAIRHIKGSVERDIHKLETFISDLVDRIGGLRNRLEEIDVLPVERTQVLPLVRGTGIGQRAALEIETGVLVGNLLVGEQKDTELTVGRVYDGITNYYSNVYDRSLRTAEDGVRLGGKLIVRPWQEILQTGERIIQLEAKRVADREKKEQIIAVVR